MRRKRKSKLIPKYTPSHPSAPWRVYHRGKSYWFKGEADAEKKCAELEQGRGEFSARELDEYRHAQQLLQGTPLMTAVRYYIERNPNIDPTMTVSEAVKAHLERATGRPTYIAKKEQFLTYLKDQVIDGQSVGEMKLGVVSSVTIERILEKIRSKWMRNDFLRHIRVVFREAVKKKIIREDPTEAFTQLKVSGKKVILTLDDTRHVLETAASQFPEILGAVALQLFSGVRTEEITRLTWEHVHDGRMINIEPEVAKTHERRVIDFWAPALTNWLPATHPKTGPIVPFPKTYEHKKWMLIAVCRKTKEDFVFGQNAFRHSFCSYACAYFENAGKGALLAGQRDINIFFNHYRDYRSKAQGEEYFTMPRTRSGKDIELSKAG